MLLPLPVSPPLVILDVAVNQRDVVFVFAADLWHVPRAGGTARRVFADHANRTAPVFSPDGTRLAFTRDGDIYVVSSEGGEPQRLTWHPKTDIARAWSADGKTILFSSDREQDGKSELYSVTMGAPLAKRLPMDSTVHGSLSPDGGRIAFTPRSTVYGSVSRRNFRGGMTAPLWITNLKTGATEKITNGSSNVIFPHWVGNRIVFGNDRRGSYNLAWYDLGSKKMHEATSFDAHGITALGYGGGSVAYVRDGRVSLYDLVSGRASEVPITIEPGELGVRDERAPRTVPAGRWVNEIALSPDGRTTALEARGEILVGGENLTKSSGAAERNPAFSPDGKRIAHFCDESGEYALHIWTLGGETRKIQIEAKPSFYRELRWSPDGVRLSFSDVRLGLWVADLSTGRVARIDVSEHMAQGPFHARWSPDGRWLTYAKALPTRVRSVFLWDSVSGQSTRVGDGLSDDTSPVFDRSGRYLYFATSSNARNAAAADTGWGLMTSTLAEPATVRRLVVAVLAKGDHRPAGDVGGGGQIDLEGLSGRILPLNLTGDVVGIEAAEAGSVVVATQEWSTNPFDGPTRTTLRRFDVAKGTAPIALDDVTGEFAVSADGSTALYQKGPEVRRIATAGGASAVVSAPSVEVDPPAEWRQMYHEAWRMMRDNFYDPNHHGQDPVALEAHYAAYLPGIVRRGDLNVLLIRAFGEISVSHLRVSGGDIRPAPTPPGPRVGTLGADFSVQNGTYRFDRIVRNGGYVGLFPRGPLEEPGVDVREGDLLLEVDGQKVTAERDVYSYFVNTVGKPTTLKVGTPDAPRETVVVPIPGENGLRTAEWARRNAETVARLSGGRLGYVYVPGHDGGGFDEFSRVLNASADKQGLIVDERYNGGGITPDSLVMALQRSPLLAYVYRYGKEFVVPPHWIDGPKVLMINEADGSAAETFAMMFRAAKVGKLVGKATIGAGIGAALYQQPLIDGGVIAIPNRASYNPYSGRWEIENEGVRPDVDVEIMPRDAMAGRDPQLEAAVAEALKGLKGYRSPKLKRPVPPVHPGGRARGAA